MILKLVLIYHDLKACVDYHDLKACVDLSVTLKLLLISSTKAFEVKHW